MTSVKSTTAHCDNNQYNTLEMLNNKLKFKKAAIYGAVITALAVGILIGVMASPLAASLTAIMIPVTLIGLTSIFTFLCFRAFQELKNKVG